MGDGDLKSLILNWAPQFLKPAPEGSDKIAHLDLGAVPCQGGIYS